MDCNDVRSQLLDLRRGRLSGDDEAAVRAHLEGCASCRAAAAADAALSDVLAEKLPRHGAPPALHERLARTVADAQSERKPARRSRRYVAPLLSAAAAAALTLAAVRLSQPGFLRAPLSVADLANEGVNDHLRVVTSEHPIEIESGGIHQVKPWFTGRLDFAPRVAFDGDDTVKLVGGSVGYFRERKAAVFVFKVRLHTITLFVFRADGLPWRERGLERVGGLQVDARVERGFNVLLWRDGELGYCLVSDVNRADLDALARRISGT